MEDELDLTEDDLKVSHESEEEDEESEDEEDLTGEEDDSKPATPAEKVPTPTEALEAKLAELENSNKGLVKSLAAQRDLRQDLQSQLNGIKAALDERRQDTVVVDDTAKVSSIPIDFDAEGNPYLDPTKLGALQSDEIVALQKKIEYLEQHAIANASQTAEKTQLNNLLSEKEGYIDAHKSVTAAWNYLKDELFDSYLFENGIAPPKTVDAALDIALDSKTIKESFSRKYPNLDLESVMEAHLIATPRYLRKALDKALTIPGNSNEQLNLSKPNSLANANSTGGDNQESLLDRVASMSNEDYAALDETTKEKINRLLEVHG